MNVEPTYTQSEWEPFPTLLLNNHFWYCGFSLTPSPLHKHNNHSQISPLHLFLASQIGPCWFLCLLKFEDTNESHEMCNIYYGNFIIITPISFVPYCITNRPQGKLLHGSICFHPPACSSCLPRFTLTTLPLRTALLRHTIQKTSDVPKYRALDDVLLTKWRCY